MLLQKSPIQQFQVIPPEKGNPISKLFSELFDKSGRFPNPRDLVHFSLGVEVITEKDAMIPVFFLPKDPFDPGNVLMNIRNDQASIYLQ